MRYCKEEAITFDFAISREKKEKKETIAEKRRRQRSQRYYEVLCKNLVTQKIKRVERAPTSQDSQEKLLSTIAGTWSLKLSVLVPPTIAEISGSQTVIEGENVTLKCLADGKPTPNITWTRLSDNSVVSMILTYISRQDAGKYRCTADNRMGSPATGDVLIIVQYPVEAKGFGENATVLEGSAKNFSCPVDGNPKPKITWYKGSEVSGKPICYEEKLEARESGCYTCAASNFLGQSVIITQCL